MDNKQHFFDFAAEVGLTKHFGGVGRTEELVELCHIGAGKVVLDVGCGAGVTPSFLVKRYGCKVVGIDISERMVERSKEKARREGVVEQVEFRVADVQDLPFDDDLFDIVVSESVTAFPADKQAAVNEYARVTKTGGYIGLSEATWLKMPPPPELIAWVSQDVGATVCPLTSEEWVNLLKGAGLGEIIVRNYEVNPGNEARELFRRYGWVGMLRVFFRMLSLYARNPAYRNFVREVRQDGVIPENLEEYFGYGIYVGRK